VHQRRTGKQITAGDISDSSSGIQNRAPGPVPRTTRDMKKLLILTAISSIALVVVVLVVMFVGPATSGALLLLLPAQQRSAPHDLPENYTPVHKGHVSLGIGLYFRENEDLVVPGTPALILRRSYASSYRTPREFGIGTTQAAEWFVIGDAKRFQWAELVRPGESRIRFERTSAGTSFFNAMFVHRGSAGDWQGARLGWTGVGWALRLVDGTLARFRACGPGENDRCSIVSYRDADGHSIRYRRNGAGRLERLESGQNRWIAFHYDEHDRVVRADASTKRELRYEYDDRGRLVRVKSGDVVTHRYTYTDLDEMATIVEPDTDIVNSYADGRCVRQLNRFADGSPPYIFDFDYTLDGSKISQTLSRRSDGTWVHYSFNKTGFTTSETWGAGDHEPASFIFERDPTTNAVVSLSLTCPDRTGRPLRHSSLVAPGREEWLKRDLVRTHCSWTTQQWRTTR
jgi:YD repeat-containing protein